MTKIRIYLDGLNFYYGIARAYNFKWIDIEELLRQLISSKISSITSPFEIEKIFLFTSSVMGDASARQHIYLTALEQHSPCIKRIPGYFQNTKKNGKLVETEQKVLVEIREEKLTDVNLACQIVDDAHTVAGKDFDVACLVTNDSDIACALKIKRRLGQRTILILPRSTRQNTTPTAKKLIKLVPKKDRISEIPEDLVRQCPLPDPLGKLYAPDAPGWSTS